MSKKLKWVCLGLCVVICVVLGIYIYGLFNVDVPDEAIREPVNPGVVETPDVVEDVPAEDPPELEPDCEPDDYYEEEPPPPPELLPRIVQLREYYDNPDIIGFLEVPGTNIYTAVAQTGNNVFYLYHDLRFNRTSAGSIFLDYENNLYRLEDDNSLIYGHNMRNGTMFHNIRYFHSEEFFRQNTYIMLDTPYRETVWDIFAFFHTSIDFCYLTTNFYDDRDGFYDFLMELQRRSIFETDIVVTAEDQILILSTCAVNNFDRNQRYVVVSRLRQDV